MLTPCAGVAAVIGADVSVIAWIDGATEAGPPETGIIHRACISIIAGLGIIGVLASGSSIAGIIRTWVSIVTVQRTLSVTGTVVTQVVCAAGISIVTGNSAARRKLTPTARLARVHCADLSIVTSDIGSRATSPSAHIGFCTRISVVTYIRCVLMETAVEFMTAIGRTRISIVTTDRVSPEALPGHTGFILRTGISVVTGTAVRQVDGFAQAVPRITDLFRA